MDTFDQSALPDPSTVSNRSIALRYGAIWGGISALISLIGTLTDTDPGMPNTGPIKWLYVLVGVGVSIWAIVAAIGADRKQLGGFIGLGRCVGLGAFTGLISGAIGAVYSLLNVYLINPDYQEQMSAAMQSEWEKQGMSAEQIEMASGMATMFTNPLFLGLSQLIGGAIFGVIVGLIAGAIMKRDRPYA